MKRGIILNVYIDHYIVAGPNGEFIKVRRAVDPDLQSGEEMFWTIEWEMNSATQNSTSSRDWSVYAKRLSAFAASLLLFIFFGNWMVGGSSLETWFGVVDPQKQSSGEVAIQVEKLPTDPRVVAYMTIDINPSIELALDAQDFVVFARAVNKDGETILKDLAVKGKAVDELAQTIVQKAEKEGFMKEKADIVIAVAAVEDVIQPKAEATASPDVKRRKKENDNRAQLEHHLKQKVSEKLRYTIQQDRPNNKDSVKITTMSVPMEIREVANEHSLSMGKLSIFLQAKKSGRQLEIKDLQEHSIHEIADPFGGVDHLLDVPEAKGIREEVKQKQQIRQFLFEMQKDMKKNPESDHSFDQQMNDDQGNAQNQSNVEDNPFQIELLNPKNPRNNLEKKKQEIEHSNRDRSDNENQNEQPTERNDNSLQGQKLSPTFNIIETPKLVPISPPMQLNEDQDIRDVRINRKQQQQREQEQQQREQAQQQREQAQQQREQAQQQREQEQQQREQAQQQREQAQQQREQEQQQREQAQQQREQEKQQREQEKQQREQAQQQREQEKQQREQDQTNRELHKPERPDKLNLQEHRRKVDK